MRKLLMTLVLGLALACPEIVYAQEAPAPDKPVAAAAAEPAGTVAAAEKPPVVSSEDLKEAGKKLLEGGKGILSNPNKIGDWKQDYLYPFLTLLITVLLALGGGIGAKFGIPYLRDKAKKAGIELNAEREKQITDIVDDAIVLAEAMAIKRILKDPANKTVSAKKAKDAMENIKKRSVVFGIDLAEDFILNKINSRHLVLAADPKSPIKSGG